MFGLALFEFRFQTGIKLEVAQTEQIFIPF